MMRMYLYISMFLLMLTACSTSPRNSYYMLTALAPLSSKQAPATLPSIAITSITLPELVDRPHLVIGEYGGKIDILQFHRWGEPLKSSVPRIMADNLSRQLGSDRVAASPQVAALDAALQISLDFQDFSLLEGFVQLDALWRIKMDGTIIHNGRTKSLQKITGGYDSVAEAYSRALAVVSADIVTQLLKRK